MIRRALHELGTLVAIPSPSGREEALLAYLDSRLSALGIPTERQPTSGPGANLLARPLPEPALLVAVHVDTVPELGNGEAYVPRVREGRLHGRGACDAKGGVAALLLAVEILRDEGTPLTRLPVTLAFTVDEEEEGRGSQALAAAVRPRGALVLEPTELGVATAQAGSVELVFEVEGRAAHGSVPEAGANAVREAVERIRRLESLPLLQGTHPLVGPGRCTVLAIQGGGEALVVPDRCRVRVDLRVLPGRDPGEVREAAEEALSGCRVQVVDVSPPFETSPDAPVVRLLQRAHREVLGRPAPLRGLPGWTDGETLSAAGVPAVLFGPGALAVAHTDRESVALKEVVAAARVLARAMALAPGLLAPGG